MVVNLELSNIWNNIILISKVEKKYNAKFVCETQIRGKNKNWRTESSLIFYNTEPHPQGSNYMALSVFYDYEEKPDLVVSNGISATEHEIVGIIDGEEIIYSRYRHDYRVGKTGVMIDGGRDYVRSSVSGPNQFVTLKIIKDKLEII